MQQENSTNNIDSKSSEAPARTTTTARASRFTVKVEDIEPPVLQKNEEEKESGELLQQNQ